MNLPNECWLGLDDARSLLLDSAVLARHNHVEGALERLKLAEILIKRVHEILEANSSTSKRIRELGEIQEAKPLER